MSSKRAQLALGAAPGRGTSRTTTTRQETRARTPAGREKLRAAGFAPPAPRLLQLQASVHRCPYCGSTGTRLENIFGPTPCRSLRYCESCRQPFEQFKTI